MLVPDRAQGLSKSIVRCCSISISSINSSSCSDRAAIERIKILDTQLKYMLVILGHKQRRSTHHCAALYVYGVLSEISCPVVRMNIRQADRQISHIFRTELGTVLSPSTFRDVTYITNAR